MKHFAYTGTDWTSTASPASNGGRGLKQMGRRRPFWQLPASPASNGGRGLKLVGHAAAAAVAPCFARQQWRAWIETSSRGAPGPGRRPASPASNGGRGLKHADPTGRLAAALASPASNGGRGLKPGQGTTVVASGVASPASNGGRGLKPCFLQQ